MCCVALPKFVFLFVAPLIFLSLHSHFSLCRDLEPEVDDESPFNYVEGTGKGPKKWGEIDPHWQVCDKGKLQSPIDLLDQRVQVFPNLGKLKRDYEPAPATIKNRGHDIEVQIVSRPKVRALQDAVDDGFEENARPTQPLNGRTVYMYSRWFF